MSINLCNISVNSFNNICRTCSQTNDLVSIHQNTYLIGMLSTVTHIQIQLNDELPKMICLNCVKDLNKSYSFISKCKATDVALRQRLSKQKMLNSKIKEDSIKPKMTEEIFIKTEITDLDEYDDPLSDEGTKDPLEHQENQGKTEFEIKSEETNEDRLSNEWQFVEEEEEEKPKRKRKRSASNVTTKIAKKTKTAKNTKTNSFKQTKKTEMPKKSATENGRNSRKKRTKIEQNNSTKNARENLEKSTNRSRIHEPLVVLKIGRRSGID